ncbi:MAG: HTTM domain-containing protein, partial [Planctomycetota bacterium]
MNAISRYFRELYDAIHDGWDSFWFTTADPATICLIRLLTGAMLLYTHAVWTLDLQGFFGQHARISPAFVQGYHDNFDTGSNWAWSYLNGLESDGLLWGLHIVGLIVLVMFMVGLWTRATSVLAFLIAISYVHRAPGALFGLDQINILLTMYVMLAPSGARYSVDAMLRSSKGYTVEKSTLANVAIRLLQIHLCILYLFAGIGKLQGTSWWSGTAMWLAMANYEYQSLDMTWLGRWPKL